MSITDELRAVAAKTECANGRCEKLYRGDLDHIADRIDAEHESKVGCTADEWDYWESTHIELPKDAHDECIYVGDVMDGYGKTIEVVELRIGRSGWVIVSRDGNAYADTSAFAHHKPPTVEDVLTDFARLYDSIGGRENEDELWDTLLAEYASKLQLRSEDE